MKRPPFAPVLVLVSMVAACPKATDSTNGQRDSRVAPIPVAVSTSSTSRLDAARVVAKWADGQITYGDLQKRHGGEFRKLKNKYVQDLYLLERRELEGEVLDTLVKKEAAAAGKTEEQYLNSISGEPSATEEEILAFYEKTVKPSGQPLAPVKERIRMYLIQEKQQKALSQEFERLKKAAKVEFDLPLPKTEAAEFNLAGRPMKGKADAKVTLVEFSDFECPYCSRAAPRVEELLDAFPGQVKVYFLHFPLSMHASAMPAAIAAQCANQQGKFWPMHDKLFENQQSLTPDRLIAYAKEVGLDAQAYDACTTSLDTRKFVEQDMAQGEAAGVQGTPAFYINGVQYPRGIPTVEEIEPYVKQQ